MDALHGYLARTPIAAYLLIKSAFLRSDVIKVNVALLK